MTRDEIIEYFENGLKLVGDQMEDKDKDAIKSCLDLLKQQKQEEEQSWPQVGDEYYTMDGDMMIHCFLWDDDNRDHKRMSIGNCFRTREEAEFTIERLKVLAEMRKFAEPFDTKWDGGPHYYIYIDRTDEGELIISDRSTYRHGEFYFGSYEKAQKCIDTVGKDRIKKYYLGVE